MTTATLDIDTLDKLFDNQKKLDDIFNSVFDEDPFLSSPTPFSDYARESNKISQASYDSYSDDEISFNTGNTVLIQRARGVAYFVLPALEIAAIYYCVINFT